MCVCASACFTLLVSTCVLHCAYFHPVDTLSAARIGKDAKIAFEAEHQDAVGRNLKHMQGTLKIISVI